MARRSVNRPVEGEQPQAGQTRAHALLSSNEWTWSLFFLAVLVAAIFGIVVEPGWEWVFSIPVLAIGAWLAGVPGVVIVTDRGIRRWSGLIPWERVVAAGWASTHESAYQRKDPSWIPVLGVVTERQPGGRWVVLRELRRSGRDDVARSTLMANLTRQGCIPRVDPPRDLPISLF